MLKGRFGAGAWRIAVNFLRCFGALALVGLFGLWSCRAEDLLEVFAQAARKDPILAREKDLFNASSAGVSVARWALGPKMQAYGGAGVASLNLSFGNVFSLATGTTAEYYTVLLTQPLLDGQSIAALRVAKSEVQAQHAMVLYQEQQMILRVVQGYLTVLQAEANRRVAAEQQELFESVWKQASAFLAVGRGDVIAASEAKARFDAAQSTLTTATNAVGIARKALERITHGPVGKLVDVGELKPLGPQPDRIEIWTRTAVDNQPLLHQARSLLTAAVQQIEQNRRAQWPVLSVVGSSAALGVNAVPLDIQTEAGFLTLSVPLFDGQIGARVKQAKAQARASQRYLDNTVDQVKLDTEEAFLNLESSVPQLQSSATAVESAKTSLDGTRKGYEIGTRSIVDLLTVITDYGSARRDYYVALYNHLLNRVQLKGAAGVLTVEDVRALNELLKKG
ncbi:TolC family protein [Methylacidimicrobium tartarophylax]|uniref:Outer membrane protein TolC n=1 Tax=Methylacidimicrobium tartarophylax TaxID=1041768 RepID=A0A5E6M8G8_9BACT|nr:TolC family protein [Methylacidimicrobium tartarophylax]VVM05537.1 Outer membrane protein TolC [Methylacidimicrobium tartarophylax]